MCVCVCVCVCVSVSKRRRRRRRRRRRGGEGREVWRLSLCCGLSLAGSQAVTLVAMTTIHGPCQPLYSCAVSAIASPPPIHTYMYMLGVLCCFALFVCLTLPASFFFPFHLSFKNMYIHTCMVCVYAHVHV